MKISDLTTQGSDSFTINSLIQQTQPSTFRRVLGGVVGGAANMVAPGLGSLVGGAISGSGSSLLGNSTGIQGALNSDSMFYLQLQEQMEAEQRAFESASNVLKSRHDAAMSAIQNIR